MNKVDGQSSCFFGEYFHEIMLLFDSMYWTMKREHDAVEVCVEKQHDWLSTQCNFDL